MIPLQLRVRNFMCYREMPPLTFDGIHLACLAGANGHGKSALLDAMTWAVWGKARAKRDDELIHLGESEMEVEFTFALGRNTYRVIRKRDSSGRGRSVLDLQVQAPAAAGSGPGEFRSIAEPGIRATQQALSDLLRMDYDTFTNSAFLLQGKADAFTMRTPTERKQVLAEILGLSRYDEYEQRARDRAREKERQVAELDGLLRDIDREVARRPEYKAELATAAGRVADLGERVRAAEAELHDLRAEQQAIEHQRSQLRDLERRLAQAEREVADVELQITTCQARVDAFETVLARRDEVQAGWTSLCAAREQEALWNERLGEYTRAQEEQRQLERQVDAARHALDLARGQRFAREQDLARRAGQVQALEDQLADLKCHLEDLQARQNDRDDKRTRLQSLAEESAGLKVRNEQLHAEMVALRQKLDMLQSESGAAACPVCGQALSDEHRTELAAEFEAEGTRLRDAHRANTARRKEIESDTERLQAEVKRLDRELTTLPGQQRREAQLDQSLEEARRAAAELEAVQGELAAMDAQIQDGAFAPEAQEALRHLTARLNALDYDRDVHQAARERVVALEPFEAEYRRLETAIERVADERSQLAALHERLDRWQETLADDRARREELAAEVTRLPQVTAHVKAQADTLDDLQRHSSRARQELGAAQQKLDHCDYLTQERERRVADRQRLAEEKAIFDDLRQAFGKKGIQAMIIETAIPEIEYEANRLLARMTDGRMHVRIETQRELVSGDTAETLDIKIADELGTRAYELFSGGEAFRVNFAIRIALSKLLARRAGAQLQMLVIDEGFGTQDADGRARLVDAINSIQDDFERILVITHIEELQDAFPVRIQVTKTEEGSQVRIA
ncbi:MAG: SMC family ATPase [Anaerolineae bacterium]|nr:SMC family ATPase [Anaerolineae bacterium]